MIQFRLWEAYLKGAHPITERKMQKSFGIIAFAAIVLTLPQLAVAQRSHRQPSASIQANGAEPIQNIDGEKIPGAPNGMLTEMLQKWQIS